MSEVYLNSEQSEFLHKIIIANFWPSEYPELAAIIPHLRMYTKDKSEEIGARMDELMAAWGLRFPRHPETHNGFIFKDETAYAQFLLRWS